MKVVFEENMIIQDEGHLKNYVTDHRIWQGIPSVEITKNGRMFVTFYSGNGGERLGNFAVVVMSDDNGRTFSEPICVAYKDEKHRCFDPCLWIDPLDRLWFTWSVMPEDGAYATICENPDADVLVWSDSFYLGEDVMMNKPVVLSTGEWYFPIAVWRRDMRKIYAHSPMDESKIPGAYVYKTADNGKTFEKMGGADAGYRDFDEHMVIEIDDDVLANYIRVDHGIGICYSYDRGRTWSAPEPCCGVEGVTTRFHIRRLKSGRLLLVYHKDTTRRNNLAAFLSEDNGKTWPYSLMLDEREKVSYPDAKESDDGFIYIVYDRERQGVSISHAYTQAREILMAKITEEDIIAGKLTNEGSRLKQIVSKLGKFYDESINFYEEPDRYSEDELASLLLSKYPDNVIGKIFDFYSVNCVNMGAENGKKLDELIDIMKKRDGDRTNEVKSIISFIRRFSFEYNENVSFVNKIKEVIFSKSDDISVSEIAEQIGTSEYYMMYRFRKITGTTITDYGRELKISKAKRLLINSDISIAEVAQQCGFGSSDYFSKVFLQSEKVSPSEYRKNLKK